MITNSDGKYKNKFVTTNIDFRENPIVYRGTNANVLLAIVVSTTHNVP